LKRKFSKILGVGVTLVLLCSLLLTASPVMAATAITGLTVSLSTSDISTGADYTITFDATNAVTATADGTPFDIIIAFPLGTLVPATGAWGAADISVQSTAGFGTARPVKDLDTSAIVTTAATTTVGPIVSLDLLAELGGDIGEGAMVRVQFKNTVVTNPATIGAYALSVSTSADTTAVTSPTYSTVAPTIGGVPGTVTWDNSSGVPMGSDSGTVPIQTAIGHATMGDNFTIKIGTGTYTDAPNTGNDGVTFVATGAAADTIISGAWTIDQATITLDGLTITGGITVTAAGTTLTIKNCVLSSTTVATLLDISGATTTIQDCTISTVGTTPTVGIEVNATTVVTGGSITVDGTDVAIDHDTASTLTLTNCTISGATGTGLKLDFATDAATITGGSFDGLSQALAITNGTVTVKDSAVINNCGVAGATLGAGTAAVAITAGTVSITNSTISNSPDYAVLANGGAATTNVMFNTLTGNLGNVNNASGAGALNATHNWWGVATGPASGTVTAATGGTVDTSGYLGASAVGTFTTTASTYAAKATANVDVSIELVGGGAVTAGIIGVGNYAENPQDATPDPALADGFFDVYIGTPTNASDVATVKLYNANITSNTVVYVWSELQGAWAPCDSQGINAFGGYAWFKTGATITPSITELGGTPLALVEPPAVAGVLVAPVISAPETGDDTVALTPTFAWEAVPAADGYYFEFADNANFVIPLIKIDGDMGRLIVTAYHYATELPYSTAYYWRVKAVSGTEAAGTLAESPWASGVFITMDEPEEPTPPIVVEEAPPVVIEQPDIIVTLPAETPITPSWIYVIIGVGAVLVIALLVLIVRTRRVA